MHLQNLFRVHSLSQRTCNPPCNPDILPMRGNWAKCPAKKLHITGHSKSAFICHKKCPAECLNCSAKVFFFIMSGEWPMDLRTNWSDEAQKHFVYSVFLWPIQDLISRFWNMWLGFWISLCGDWCFFLLIVAVCLYLLQIYWHLTSLRGHPVHSRGHQVLALLTPHNLTHLPYPPVRTQISLLTWALLLPLLPVLPVKIKRLVKVQYLNRMQRRPRQRESWNHRGQKSRPLSPPYIHLIHLESG